jgi:hypothetical protein
MYAPEFPEKQRIIRKNVGRGLALFLQIYCILADSTDILLATITLPVLQRTGQSTGSGSTHRRFDPIGARFNRVMPEFDGAGRLNRRGVTAIMMRYFSPPIVVPIGILILVLVGAYVRMH